MNGEVEFQTGIRVCGLPSVNRPTWKCRLVAVIALIVIFSAGAISGAAGYAYWHHAQLLWLRENPAEIPDLVVGKLSSSLSLSPDQIPKVAELVRRRHIAFDRIQAKIHPEIDAECAEYELEMQQLLTPRQYEIWLPHFREIRKIWLP